MTKKQGAAPEMPSYGRVMKRLERLGRRLTIVRGTPMSDKAIDSMEKKLKVKVGAEYRTFLRETGGLEVFDPKGEGRFVVFGRSKGRFDTTLFGDLPYYEPHRDFATCLVVSCEFARFQSKRTYERDDDPFAEVQEYVLMPPSGEGFMEVRGVACEGGGFDTFRPELITFDELFASFDAALDEVDPKGASRDDGEPVAIARPVLASRSIDSRVVEATITRTIGTTGAAALLFYVDAVDVSDDQKDATLTLGINLPESTPPEVAKQPCVTALLAKLRAAVHEKHGLTLKHRLFLEVLESHDQARDDARHVARLAKLVSGLKHPDPGAAALLAFAQSRTK